MRKLSAHIPKYKPILFVQNEVVSVGFELGRWLSSTPQTSNAPQLRTGRCAGLWHTVTIRFAAGKLTW